MHNIHNYDDKYKSIALFPQELLNGKWETDQISQNNELNTIVVSTTEENPFWEPIILELDLVRESG